MGPMTAPASASPYATRDEASHAHEMGRVHPDEVHEFYGPFAMVDDLIEFVHIVSPTHGELDTALLLQPQPPQIYVSNEAGERFLRERYPNARRFRVPARQLLLESLDQGRAIVCHLTAQEGPFRRLSVLVRADAEARCTPERYEARGVWGSSGLVCVGVDLRLPARATGRIDWADGTVEAVDRPAVLFRGSYGKIQPITRAGEARHRR